MKKDDIKFIKKLDFETITYFANMLIGSTLKERIDSNSVIVSNEAKYIAVYFNVGEGDNYRENNSFASFTDYSCKFSENPEDEEYTEDWVEYVYDRLPEHLKKDYAMGLYSKLEKEDNREAILRCRVPIPEEMFKEPEKE